MEKVKQLCNKAFVFFYKAVIHVLHCSSCLFLLSVFSFVGFCVLFLFVFFLILEVINVQMDLTGSGFIASYYEFYQLKAEKKKVVLETSAVEAGLLS